MNLLQFKRDCKYRAKQGARLGKDMNDGRLHPFELYQEMCDANNYAIMAWLTEQWPLWKSRLVRLLIRLVVLFL